MAETRRSIVERIRRENKADFARTVHALDKVLDAGHPHPWMYVYELTQNALDSGAKRVSWRLTESGVMLQHDGSEILSEPHVRGISGLGATTKGLSAVGFMGVGFKSVFQRFRVARVTGSGWSFRFDMRLKTGSLGNVIKQWLDTLLPQWDESAPEPDPGFTTAIRLEEPLSQQPGLEVDLSRIASKEDPTSLAVLALRGLREFEAAGTNWFLTTDGRVIEARLAKDGRAIWQWRVFFSRYTPDDAAMRRFLEVRRELNDDIDEDGNRVQREVVALVQLVERIPASKLAGARIYATLPTQTQMPFGFDLQGDWLVNLDRQNLRHVFHDPWQMAIIRQIPVLLRKVLD